jgi:LysM repeat protein
VARRRWHGLLAGLVLVLGAGALLGCGGDSPLEIVPTTTIDATQASQPAAVPAVTSTPETQEYTVQAGDTLSGIAQEFGVTVEAIVEANEIADPNLIMPGETLIIPAP